MKALKTLIVTAMFAFLFVAGFSNEASAGPRFGFYFGVGPRVVVTKPGPNYVWVEGHYKLNKWGKWVWVPGHWKRC